MKNLLLTLACLTVFTTFAGCSSQEAKQQPPAAVEEVKPAPAPMATASPAPTQPIVVDPLRDPNNILYKRSVYYDFDSSLVSDEYKPLVTAHAQYLVANSDAKITIQGNCDERGSREYNVALGQRRADTVKRMMQLYGATDAQIETVSLGNEKPKNQGHDEAAWAENRRDDLVYTGE